jgi:hypothetical protein
MLARVRDHSHPEGCFLFETRNPNSRNLLQVRHPEPRKLTMPDGGQQEEKTLRTALRYVFPQEMEALLFYNGFQIRACYGDWQQSPLTATSPAMIHVCRRRS